MAFELPALPYDYEALQPYMSKETLEFHHDKHHKAYVDNGNKLAAEAGMDKLSLEGDRQAVLRQECRPLQQCRPALQSHPFLEMDEEGRRRQQAAGHARRRPSTAISAATTSSGRISSRPARRSSARAGPGSRSRTASSPFRRRRTAKTRSSTAQADPRRRCLGALLLHRLPQCPPEISRGLRRQSDQLGLRAGTLREGLIGAPRRAKTPAVPGGFACGRPQAATARNHVSVKCAAGLFLPVSIVSGWSHFALAQPETSHEKAHTRHLKSGARHVGRVCRTDCGSQGDHEGTRRPRRRAFESGEGRRGL